MEQRYGDKLLIAASACLSEAVGRNEISLSRTGNAAVKARARRQRLASVM